MRTAICHYSFHRRYPAEKWTPQRMAQEVKALGVPGIDFHARLLGGDPAGAPKAIREAMAGSGLELASLSMGNNFNLEDPAAVQVEIDNVKKWLNVAAEVKAPVSRIFGGGMKYEDRIQPKVYRQGQQRIQKALGQLLREAERLKVVLALENHGGLPCTGEEQVEIIRAFNSPYLRATVDVGNYLSGGQEGLDGTRAAAACAAYVHFKDFKKIADPSVPYGYKLESCVVGAGDVDHRGCLKALKAAGYDGVIALEYEGVEAEVTGVPKSVAFMKKVIAEV